MALFRRSLAKRLRTGTQWVLLLNADPGERVLDAVRRFDPRARPGDGFVELTFCQLTGPIEVTPELAAAARLPQDLPVAFLAEHFGPQNSFGAVRLIRGLAHLLDGVWLAPGGTVRHRAGRTGPAETWMAVGVASVCTADLIPPDDLVELVSPYLPDPKVIHENSPAEYSIGGGAVTIGVRGLISDDPALPPWLRRDPRAQYECSLSVTAMPTTPEPLHQAGEVALAIAAGTNGVPLDVYGFLIVRPEDVFLED